MRDSFVFYSGWYNAINNIPEEERLKAYDAIMRYALFEEEPEMGTIASAIFLMAKPIIEKNNVRYENGKRGGRPKNQTETKAEPNHNQTITKPEPNVNVNDNVNVINNRAKRFAPPTLQQVKDYCSERKNSVDAEQFIDFYSAKNWMIGKNRMKDWKAAVRTWEKRDKQAPNKNKFNQFPHNEYDFDELERQLGVI